MRLIKFFVIMGCGLAVCPLVSAQNTPRGEVTFPWRPGEIPTQFWIGRTNERCVNVSGQGGVWLARTVLSTAKPGAVGEWLCSFSWNGGDAQPDLTALRRVTGGRLEADPPIVTANGADPERDLKWFEPLYALTRARLGMPSKRDPHKLTDAVRVAILDTAADTASGVVDPSGHGRAVGQLVHELACGEHEKCATRIGQLPALPFASRPNHTLTLQSPGTGAIGTRATVAAAIEEASSAWQNSARRLVINLSLGWSGCWERDARTWPRFDQLLRTRRDLGSQAVVTALGRAVCRGALVVAASGNGDAQTACPTKPAAPGAPRRMFPGLWGGTRLDPSVCSSLGVDATFNEPRPLLVAVGAVDDIDQRLATTYHEANWVTYGQVVTVPDAQQASGWTLPLSGTSMSAAALTGIAAALWSYEPALSHTQLLAAIGKAAMPLRPAPTGAGPDARDFVCNETWSGGVCPEVARLSLCGALGARAADCDTPAAASQTRAGFATMSPIADALVAVDCGTCGNNCPAECDDDDGLDALTGPWVDPQPKPPGCGTCVFVPTQQLFQAEFVYDVGSPVLKVYTPGQPEARYALLSPLVPAYVPTTWLLPLGAATGTTAVLVYRASSSMAKESGDVVVDTVPPFTVGTVLGGP